MNKNFLRLFIIYGVLLIALDQGTKYWSESTLHIRSDATNTRIYQGSRSKIFEWGQMIEGSEGLIPDGKVWVLLQFNYVRNHGAAWGSFASVSDSVRLPIFHLLTVVFCAFLVGLAFSKIMNMGFTGRIGVALMVSGALGNLIDRVTRGYVVDLFDLRWHLLGWRSSLPVFNAADVFIVLGLLLFIVNALRR